MSARSLIRKIKQMVGLSDGSGSESDTSPSVTDETDVTVEREPETADEIAVEDTSVTAVEDEETTEEDEETIDTAETEESSDQESGESVEKIKGIGPTYRDRLADADLGTVPKLAESDPETVAEVAQTSEGRAEEWIKRAKNR